MRVDEMTVHCPKCDSEDIREKNEAYAELAVDAWDWDEDEGAARPFTYDTDVDVDWEVMDHHHQYICYGCRWEGTLEDLKVKNAPTPDQP